MSVQIGADGLVNQPPGRDGVASRRGLLVGRVDVNAAEQLALLFVEQRVVERLLSRYFPLVSG